MSFILLGILNSQVTGAGGGSYELIESNILTSSASSVTFSSIPQDYKHLQIRSVVRTNRAAASDSISIRFNSDSGSNYASHVLRGTGSSVVSSASTSQTRMLQLFTAGNTATSNVFGSLVLDILDYTSASKNTTTRSLAGNVDSATGNTDIALNSGLWMNTAAITSVLIEAGFGTGFVSGSRFSLYGIRG